MEMDIKHKTFYTMNEILLFALLAGLGGLCYYLFFKCIDWFEKI